MIIQDIMFHTTVTILLNHTLNTSESTIIIKNNNHMVSYDCFHEVLGINSASLCWYHEDQTPKDSLKCGSSAGTIHEFVNVLEFHVGQFRALLKTIIQS